MTEGEPDAVTDGDTVVVADEAGEVVVAWLADGVPDGFGDAEAALRVVSVWQPTAIAPQRPATSAIMMMIEVV